MAPAAAAVATGRARSRKRPYRMCPPSSCPIGNRFNDVIRSPTQPAMATGPRANSCPTGTATCVSRARMLEDEWFAQFHRLRVWVDRYRVVQPDHAADQRRNQPRQGSGNADVEEGLAIPAAGVHHNHRSHGPDRRKRHGNEEREAGADPIPPGLHVVPGLMAQQNGHQADGIEPAAHQKRADTGGHEKGGREPPPDGSAAAGGSGYLDRRLLLEDR